MKSVQAHVVNGHLVVDEPSSLPEGSVVRVVVVDDGDDLDDDERAALHGALQDGWDGLRDGHRVASEDVLKVLRQPR